MSNSVSETPCPLAALVTSYPILQSLASWLTAKDLYHLALTNREHFSCILSSKELFKKLQARCLCDGRGLKRRRKLYHRTDYSRPRRRQQEPKFQAYVARVTARMKRVKCREWDSLPCFKCGTRVCEECRSCPREELFPDQTYFPYPRPHQNAPWQAENVMYLCPPCDEKAHSKILEGFSRDECDCNLYERWICVDCVDKERSFTSDYFKKHTVWEHYPENEEDETKMIQDHQFNRSVCLH